MQSSIFGGCYVTSNPMQPFYMFQIIPQFQPINYSIPNSYDLGMQQNNSYLLNCYPNHPNASGTGLNSQKKIEQRQIKLEQDKKNFEQIKQIKQNPQNIQKQLKVPKQSKKQQSLVCKCKKSNCLKQYCNCYKNGVGCGKSCGCLSCKNLKDRLNQKYEIEKPKQQNCNCSRSQCSKKYCECFAAGRRCGQHCKCTECQN